MRNTTTTFRGLYIREHVTIIVRVCDYVPVSEHVNVCVWLCVRACMRECVQACVRMCMSA